MSLPDKLSTALVSGNIYVHRRRTSIRLEPEIWEIFHEIAANERVSIHDLASGIAESKLPHASLTGAIRVFIVLYLRKIADFRFSSKAFKDEAAAPNKPFKSGAD